MDDLRNKLGMMTPDELQKIYDEQQNEAVQILNKMQNNEEVSRWKIFSLRKDIRRILSCDHDYSDEVVHEVHSAIESAKESL
jgi:hypothetical protein